MQEEILNILKKSNLSVTQSRVDILSLFFETKGALAHSSIEKLSGKNFDRVTIYRTLHTFMEKGIIHSIPTADNSILYALCQEHCHDGHHVDNHVHFICDNCGKTFCLDKIITPNIKLPKGFQTLQTNVLLEGICDKCASKN